MPGDSRRLLTGAEGVVFGVQACSVE